MVSDAPVRIENRAQLIYLLTEAAELEHGIMCCYLFAAFSMKRDTTEGISQEQLDIIRRWRGVILQIAIQEMVHMSLACNLLTAIGGAPHTRRPNLPSSPQAYPPSFRLQLLPFCKETLDSFVFIERPEEEEASSGETGGSGLPSRGPVKFSDIFSSERPYQTVGRLYRGIEDGLGYLSQKYGEDQLFLGPKDAQIADAYFSLPGLFPVTGLQSGVAAIEGIVEQGEGARGDNQDSHHGRFLTIQEEYQQLLRGSPKFEPGRPVLHNPYSILPSDVASRSEINLIQDPLSVDVCNLFDGCYEVLMQMLGRLLLHSGESEAQLIRLSDITVGMMMDVISPLGDVLTTLPAGGAFPGKTSGPSFRFSRDGQALPHQAAAWAFFTERLKELSAYCAFLQAQGTVSSVLSGVRGRLAQYAEQLAQ